MRLAEAVSHEINPRLAHTTFECSACGDIERRLMLDTEIAVAPAALATIPEAPPTAHEAPPSPPEALRPTQDVSLAAAVAQPRGDVAVVDEATAKADQALLRNAWAILKGWRRSS
jgi:hypothetical protein